MIFLEQRIYNLLPSDLPKVIGELPGTREDAVAIVLFNGSGNDEYFGFQTVYRPIVKIIVRNRNYEFAKQQVETVKSTLHKHSDDYFLSILLQGYPLYLGKSEQKLHEFQLTFNIQTKE